ncbi:MAG: hypothetical protein A2X13_04040 [Bacteroidetes bacterium GWC2_33_15]|nr:MAG: hypothetical protein A2X10_00805 [Bacteroidetes bacterium GWA2_33_15]OFX49693.1 MAG: hypothetical protein A2X13_04040 [Bacteroidetes bacterium GWC2_33_15]OFX65917.1 MAG: hypothetical protein A2X15_10795 [Bacteroidetes bacterium GWB2_32_14]OFX68322.1 MAG: hypothetical protein A2X14_08100 [Bacteroidetes bacterium GWD2_33_33]HAN18107.1 hypothetical protein [Bacteroidales bacterium]
MKLLFEHEKANLFYNEDTNSIELIWKKNQDSETYKLMFTKAVEFMKTYKTTGFLSDIRKEGVVGTESTKWMQQEIIPKAISFGLKKIAVVMEADIFKEFYVKNLKKVTDKETIKYFDSEESARGWLKEI